MRFRSTGGLSPEVGLAEAIRAGLAPDGGLYYPTALPPFPPGFLDQLRDAPPDPARTGTAVLTHLLTGDGGLSPDAVERAARRALDFPLPLVPLTPRIHLLELYHGPTLAFKDVGARVMARLLSELDLEEWDAGPSGAGRAQEASPLTILAATSGDTGGAVASAFHGVPGTRVLVLFPLGQVSPRQEAQFTTLGGNTLALGVKGSFDDCQRMVKEAFRDPELRTGHRLTSANSINVGRLLPQIVYHVHGWVQLPPGEGRLLVSVPSGNFGNLTAGLLARRMGLPVDHFVAATNVNDVVPGYLAGGVYRPRPSRRTISSAMDVGDPSNFSRILALYDGDREAIRADVTGSAWTDDATRECIVRVLRETGVLLDPHGAVGYLGLEAALGQDAGARGIVLGTAHPAKFTEVVEPLIREAIPLPHALAARLGAKRRVLEIPPTLAGLRRGLEADLR